MTTKTVNKIAVFLLVLTYVIAGFLFSWKIAACLCVANILTIIIIKNKKQ